MPLKYFTCPDGEEIEILDCYEECRMSHRCATLPYLYMVADERTWDGTPHVTQLIQGTMESFLKITEDYSIKPVGAGAAFSTLGIGVHSLIDEAAAKIGHPAEVGFKDPGRLQGTMDYLEPNQDGTYNLYDYKTWGSFAVAKAKGIQKFNMGRGSKPVFRTIPDKADNHDVELQMNCYRVEAKRLLGIEIRDMWVQAIVRDGNTYVAQSRGVPESGAMIPVKRLPDEYVVEYFALKRTALMRALDTWERKQDLGDEFKSMPGDAEPILCNEKERWDNDAKCRNYCAVAFACEFGKQFQLNVEESSSPV